MRSRRRRLQRQRKNSNERFRPAVQCYTWAKDATIGRQQARVWGRPRGCFDHAGKLRSAAR
jgi:hypothetical protein